MHTLHKLICQPVTCSPLSPRAGYSIAKYGSVMNVKWEILSISLHSTPTTKSLNLKSQEDQYNYKTLMHSMFTFSYDMASLVVIRNKSKVLICSAQGFVLNSF